MKPALAAVAALLILAYVPTPAVANHVGGGCVMTSSSSDPAHLFFSSPTAYVYVETNGFPGIQRGDPQFQDQTCFHPSDSFVPILWCFGPLCIF